MKAFICLGWVMLFGSALAQEDIKGSNDHPLFPRMPGYVIGQYETADNDTSEIFMNTEGMPRSGAVRKTTILYYLKNDAKETSADALLSYFQTIVKNQKPISEYRNDNEYFAEIIISATDTWVHFKPMAPHPHTGYVLVIGENPRITGRVPGAPSRFSGSYRSLVGKKISDIKELTTLSGFSFTDKWSIGSASEYDFNGMLSVSWYTKGNLIVALYTSDLFVPELNKKIIIVLDVLEITNVRKDQMLTIGVCQEEGKPISSLAALVQPDDKANTLAALQAWYFNPGTFQIEPRIAAKVKCLPTGQE
ncbi:MAG: hypothetical protein JSS93_04490 [Bacteroidetes bacterium]|nr:hypothetical protein [Bacteroidota bacterium]